MVWSSSRPRKSLLINLISNSKLRGIFRLCPSVGGEFDCIDKSNVSYLPDIFVFDKRLLQLLIQIDGSLCRVFEDWLFSENLLYRKCSGASQRIPAVCMAVHKCFAFAVVSVKRVSANLDLS